MLAKELLWSHANLATHATSRKTLLRKSAFMSEREERLFRSQTRRNVNHIFLRDEANQHILEPDGELSDLEIEDDEDLDQVEDDLRT
ncbi:hypothetical protein QYM36_000198 [Artemia franciscana]|uniref:Uncharacterized protein n=1 Tax=Artemia franciscana TaxID=6661 RepID=A0AA88IC60_ARTSF|nr:hypothetical protein QYM36_000198 [Artemia franciscana]